MSLSKEKLVTLTAYKQSLKDKLSSGIIPEKHEDHPVQYTEFLRRELSNVNLRLENDALERTAAPSSGPKGA